MEGKRQDATRTQEEERAIEWIEAEEVPEEERWTLACIQNIY